MVAFTTEIANGLPFSIFSPLRDLLINNFSQPLYALLLIALVFGFFTNKMMMKHNWLKFTIFSIVWFYFWKYMLQVV